MYFCSAFAINAFVDIIKGVNNALYIGNSKLPQSESPVDGIAEKMSRVSCIYYSRSVPGILYPKGTLLGGNIAFSVGLHLLVNR